MEHAKMAAGACQEVHWIISNMDDFVDRNLQAALPAALTDMQLPATAAISALPPTPTPHQEDVDGIARLTLAPDEAMVNTTAPSIRLQAQSMLEGPEGTLQC